MAPNYGAAKVLQLMIKKQTDPAGFQKDATAQIDTYMNMAEDRGNREGQKTAYLALLDYSKLDPKFAAQTKARRSRSWSTPSGSPVGRPPPSRSPSRMHWCSRHNLTQQQGTPEAYQAALDAAEAGPADQSRQHERGQAGRADPQQDGQHPGSRRALSRRHAGLQPGVQPLPLRRVPGRL